MQVLIPPGMAPLLGDETQKCRAFLDAVGLPDEEAALVHLDVGRTFFRQRLEVSDVDEAAAGARTFQKLIYVSSQLFGEVRSGFLTPWVARFGVSPEQVAIAKRESGAFLLPARSLGPPQHSMHVSFDRTPNARASHPSLARTFPCTRQCTRQ